MVAALNSALTHFSWTDILTNANQSEIIEEVRTVVVPQPEGPEAVLPRNRVIATVGVLLALALTSIDLSVVGAAMPKITEDLGGLRLYSWVGVGYSVAAAVILPIAGKLGDLFGRKPFLLTGLVGFLVTSFLCGAAQSMTQLVIYRGAQGLFAGILMANIYTVVADIYTPERRAQTQGIFFSVAGLSMVIGPPIGGVITDNLDWRWVFYINVPILLLSVLAITAGVPYVKSRFSWRDIDFLGVALLIAGLVPILIGLSLAGDGHAWTSAEVLILLIGGAVMLVGFFLAENRAEHAIVPLSLFRGNQFSVLAVMSFFTAFAMMGAIFYVPLLMQGVLGSSATFAGSLLSPMMFALMIVPPIASKAITAVPRYRILGALAMALVAGGLFLLSTVDTGSGRGSTVVAMILLGIGIGISFPMATIVVQSAVAKEMIGVGTSQMQFWRMIAGPVSLALMGSILSLQLGRDATAADSVPPAQLADALHTVFLTATFIVLIGFVATLFLKEVPVRAMPSMMRRKKKPQPGAAGADAAPAPQATEGAAGAPGTVRRTEAGEA